MSDHHKQRRKPWLIAAIALISLAALATWAVLSRKAELAAAPGFTASPVAVHTVTARPGAIVPARDYLAEAEAVRSAGVNARVTETIEEVAVDEGDRVARGDLLIRLDTSEIQALLEGVAADINRAKAERRAEKANKEARAYSRDFWAREVERIRQLREQNMASQADLDSARNQLNEVEGQLEATREQLQALAAGLESLRARRSQLRSQRSNYRLKAPFEGTVTARTVDPGDQAAPGRMLIRVSSLRNMRLAFGVPEEDRPAVKTKRTVHFSLNGTSHEAAIDRIHPALDDAGLARAEVDLPAGVTVPPGAEIPVSVTLPALESTVTIPAGALAGRNQKPSVYVVINGKAKARAVTVFGRDNDDRVAVSGIEPDAEVVITPYLGWTRLADGMPVTEAGQ